MIHSKATLEDWQCNADLKWKIIGLTMAAALITICLGIFYLRRWRKASEVQDNGGRSREEPELLNLVSFDRHTTINELKKDVKKGNLKIFNYESIMEATNRFSRENLVGKGGFGPVYKGLLPMGEEIAIKRLSRGSSQGAIEFKNELILIAELQHVNLVQLLGCCIHEEERMLIYEFMPNKSLDLFLFDSTHSKLLDFGLAKIFTQESRGSTQRIVGTYGYKPPEYAMEGIFSIKSDVYSFGILMLEIVSGRRNNSFYNENSSLKVVGHVTWELWKDGATLELVDQGIKDSLVQDEALRCIHVALLCVEEKAVDRPTMETLYQC
ncbi:hypothetical protein K1719_012678 [Acacia pycnantha]|nr:hypothetical protein K1719_012678 [Acacia pycnantha]